MSLASKLRLGLGVMLALVTVQAWTHINSTNEAKTVFENDINVNYLATEKLAEMVKTAHEMRRYEKEFFIYLNGKKRDKYVKEWTQAHDALKNQLNDLRINPTYRFSDDDIEQMNQWQRALGFYGTQFKRIITATSLARVGSEALNTISANEAIGPGKNRLKILFSGSQRMAEARKLQSKESYAAIEALFEQADITGLGLALGGFVIGLLMMMTLPRAIIRPLESFTKVVDEMSRNLVGDKIDQDTVVAEFHPLATSLERLRISQAGLVARLRKKRADANRR